MTSGSNLYLVESKNGTNKRCKITSGYEFTFQKEIFLNLTPKQFWSLSQKLSSNSGFIFQTVLNIVINNFDLKENYTYSFRLLEKKSTLKYLIDDGENFVDASKKSESNIEDESSIFLGLNYNPDDSGDDQNRDQTQSDQTKSVEKENTTAIQKPPEKEKEKKSEKQITDLPTATVQKPPENESRNTKAVTGLASLACYGSSDDEN